MSEHDNQRTAEMFDCIFDAAYRDGVNQNNDVGAGTGTAGQDMELLCSNWVGTPHGGQHATEVIAFSIYSATLTDAQMAAVAAAMAAL